MASERAVTQLGPTPTDDPAFADAFVARALGIPAKTDTFLYGLTWERYGEMKTQKLRVMVIKPSDLRSLFEDGHGPSEIGLAEESHRPRLGTLRQMYELWTSPHADDRSAIGQVELGMPLHRQPAADPT